MTRPRVDIVIATRNAHKVRELTRLLPLTGVRWHSLAEFPAVPPVREDGRTYTANAIKKARAAARATGMPALADDSGLEVRALDWAPGIRSARFAGAHGDDGANNAKLLRLLDGVPPAKRGARYQCVLALAAPDGRIMLARGTWRGRIALKSAGRGGFGYDPLFWLPGLGKTVGQLPVRRKHRLSHRARAAARMLPMLRRFVRTSPQGNPSTRFARSG